MDLELPWYIHSEAILEKNKAFRRGTLGLFFWTFILLLQRLPLAVEPSFKRNVFRQSTAQGLENKLTETIRNEFSCLYSPLMPMARRAASKNIKKLHSSLSHFSKISLHLYFLFSNILKVATFLCVSQPSFNLYAYSQRDLLNTQIFFTSAEIYFLLPFKPL